MTKGELFKLYEISKEKYKDIKYGECSKHPGNSLLNCFMCGLEESHDLTINISGTTK